MTDVQIPAFIKWLGGKRRLLAQIGPYLPYNVDRYFEPFLGGGAMFFYIKQKYDPKFSMISDINKDLISTFVTVRDKPKELVEKLKYFDNNNSEEFYYKTRERFNQNEITGVRRAAAFIYFTKACFNGVYRINKEGKFNVPYGYYKDREIYNKEEIIFASQLLQGTDIRVQDYNKILTHIERNDLIYLDPCYDPLKRTSFMHYTKDRFSMQDRAKLYDFMLKVRAKRANVVLSNNNIEDVENLYSSNGFTINHVEAARCVNVNPRGRGRIPELLITNFKTI
ncbi:MAG: Dam family site-specific DNA-(adenine-N6)-methyltransferase [Candidatus Micrarchaeota archaeon]|nr:Dam family site-specific DNA-(adenine-N6)-methyltransferase [Candidatus Micrarchaeota archaeon]